MGRYKEVDDEGVELPGGKHFFELACCDCGLVHRMDFEHKPFGRGRKIFFRSYRDERATGQARRWMKKRGVLTVDKS